MTIKLNDNIDFGYDEYTNESVNFDSGSSPERSFSSTASSPYNPFTPDSRTSTPQQLINFDPTFHRENMMFDLIPSPSAISNCFLMDYNEMPSIAMRYNNIFDTSIPYGNPDFTPIQDMELYNLSESLGSSAFLVSSPSQQFNGNALNYDLASIWAPYTDSSPITFSSPGIHLATPPESSPFSNHHGYNRRRVAINEPQIKSAMLQQYTMDQLVEDQLVEEQYALRQITDEDIEQARYQSAYNRHIPYTTTKTRMTKPKSVIRRSDPDTPKNHRVSNADLDISHMNKGKYKCDILDCPKRYIRAEHLKRHKDG